jgi:hypothetical protein
MELLTEKMNSTFLQLLSHFTSDHRFPASPAFQATFMQEAIASASQWVLCMDQIIDSPGFSSFSDETIKILLHATYIIKTNISSVLI